MTTISNSGRGLQKKLREAEDHDVSNIYVKRRHEVGQNEDKMEREEKCEGRKQAEV